MLWRWAWTHSLTWLTPSGSCLRSHLGPPGWPALCQDSPGPLTAEMWSLYASWWFALLARPCSSEVPSLTPPDVLSCPHPESPDLPVFSPTQGLLACFLMTLPASRFQARPSLSLPSQANTSTQHLLLSCEPGCQTFQGPWGPMATAGREWEGHGGGGCVVGDPGGLGAGSWQRRRHLQKPSWSKGGLKGNLRGGARAMCPSAFCTWGWGQSWSGGMWGSLLSWSFPPQSGPHFRASLGTLTPHILILPGQSVPGTDPCSPH